MTPHSLSSETRTHPPSYQRRISLIASSPSASTPVAHTPISTTLSYIYHLLLGKKDVLDQENPVIMTDDPFNQHDPLFPIPEHFFLPHTIDDHFSDNIVVDEPPTASNSTAIIQNMNIDDLDDFAPKTPQTDKNEPPETPLAYRVSRAQFITALRLYPEVASFFLRCGLHLDINHNQKQIIDFFRQFASNNLSNSQDNGIFWTPTSFTEYFTALYICSHDALPILPRYFSIFPLKLAKLGDNGQTNGENGPLIGIGGCGLPIITSELLHQCRYEDEQHEKNQHPTEIEVNTIDIAGKLSNYIDIMDIAEYLQSIYQQAYSDSFHYNKITITNSKHHDIGKETHHELTQFSRFFHSQNISNTNPSSTTEPNNFYFYCYHNHHQYQVDLITTPCPLSQPIKHSTTPKSDALDDIHTLLACTHLHSNTYHNCIRLRLSTPGSPMSHCLTHGLGSMIFCPTCHDFAFSTSQPSSPAQLTYAQPHPSTDPAAQSQNLTVTIPSTLPPLHTRPFILTTSPLYHFSWLVESTTIDPTLPLASSHTTPAILAHALDPSTPSQEREINTILNKFSINSGILPYTVTNPQRQRFVQYYSSIYHKSPSNPAQKPTSQPLCFAQHPEVTRLPTLATLSPASHHTTRSSPMSPTSPSSFLSQTLPKKVESSKTLPQSTPSPSNLTVPVTPAGFTVTLSMRCSPSGDCETESLSQFSELFSPQPPPLPTPPVPYASQEEEDQARLNNQLQYHELSDSYKSLVNQYNICLLFNKQRFKHYHQFLLHHNVDSNHINNKKNTITTKHIYQHQTNPQTTIKLICNLSTYHSLHDMISVTTKSLILQSLSSQSTLVVTPHKNIANIPDTSHQPPQTTLYCFCPIQDYCPPSISQSLYVCLLLDYTLTQYMRQTGQSVPQQRQLCSILHCVVGRGRTGCLNAQYLIYKHWQYHYCNFMANHKKTQNSPIFVDNFTKNEVSLSKSQLLRKIMMKTPILAPVIQGNCDPQDYITSPIIQFIRNLRPGSIETHVQEKAIENFEIELVSFLFERI